MVTPSKVGIFKPKAWLSNADTLSKLDTKKPRNYKDVLSHPQWKHAMLAEYDAFLRKNLIFYPLPPNPKVVGSKWVFRLKLKLNGEVYRYKARLVAQGSN